MARKRPTAESRDRALGGPILVIGLGRFGGSLARTLVDLGHEVLGVDADPEAVDELAPLITQAVQADTSTMEALAQLGAGDFNTAVVGIGDVEASVLTTAALVDLGVGEIWAKAVTGAHGRILERVGAHHVVYPEHDMGERVAHVVGGRMIDFIALDPGFALVETRVPGELVGKSLGEAGVRQRYGVTVVCIKPAGQSFTYATPETVVNEDDILVVAGETSDAERFATLS